MEAKASVESLNLEQKRGNSSASIFTEEHVREEINADMNTKSVKMEDPFPLDQRYSRGLTKQ